MRWLLPVQVPGAIGCQGSSSFMLRPAGGLSLNATTAGAVRLVQLRPDAGGCFRPPQGSWKSSRKAIGRVSRYAKQTYYSLIRHGSVCNTFQEPTVTSTIVAKKTTAWGESGFPARLLGCHSKCRPPLLELYGFDCANAKCFGGHQHAFRQDAQMRGMRV